MPGANEIKGRIEGVSETKKITDAMYMISSAKMRKAARSLAETTPYFEALSLKIGELFRYIPRTENRYFRVPRPEDHSHRNHGILLITSDKGLAGGYNQEALHLCEKLAASYARTTVFIIGEYGRQYYLSRNLPFCSEFHYAAGFPSVNIAMHICSDLLEYYDRGELDEINIIYTDYTANKPADCKNLTLLPLNRTTFHNVSRTEDAQEKEFLPDPETVLERVIPSYIMGFIYGCLVESYCSEQQARMNAMNNAGTNAEDILKELKLRYNKIRQAAITEEITEITAGAKAQKAKHNASGAE